MGKILAAEDLIMQALEIILQDGEVLMLGSAMRIVENAAAPNEQNKLIANSFSLQHSVSNSSPPAPTSTPTSSNHPTASTTINLAPMMV
jgi:hypothetical protein